MSEKNINVAVITITFMQPPQWLLNGCVIGVPQVRHGILLGRSSKAGENSLNGKSQASVEAEIGK